MADSGEEQIMAALVARLQGITASNGFVTTVAEVVRYDEANDYLSQPVSIVVVQGSTTYDHQDSYNQVLAVISVALELTLVNYETARRESLVNAFVADVQKRLQPIESFGDGTLLFDLRWRRVDRFLRGGDAPRAGAVMTVDLHTHLNRSDPFAIVNCN